MSKLNYLGAHSVMLFTHLSNRVVSIIYIPKQQARVYQRSSNRLGWINCSSTISLHHLLIHSEIATVSEYPDAMQHARRLCHACRIKYNVRE
jgi:hypothetical protein